MVAHVVTVLFTCFMIYVAWPGSSKSIYSVVVVVTCFRGFLGGLKPETAHSFKSLDQDQDSLLVKRRNDNHSPGWNCSIFFFIYIYILECPILY